MALTHQRKHEERLAITQESRIEEVQAEAGDEWAVVILWSAREPERVGEVALLGTRAEPMILGRNPDAAHLDASLRGGIAASGRPVAFCRQRPLGVPGGLQPEDGSPFLRGEGISRCQLLIAPGLQGLEVENIGRCALLINGQPVAKGLAPAGATIHLKDQLLLYCTRRPRQLRAIQNYPVRCIHRFGEADAFGLVGESPAIWALRERAAVLARGEANILIVGESGTGKELAAHIIHGLSVRASKGMVSTNISAIASSLATVQLFGNRKGFPQASMPETRGLIGAADGSTLFLDEIGDMPIEVQPMFLRVTDEGREYHRLGEEDRPPRRSDFRLVGATNRPEQMRRELLRRFTRTLQIPSLHDRREDIPLLVRHLLRLARQKGDSEVEHFFVDDEPQVHPLLIDHLIRHRYHTHVAEIATLLGQAMAGSRRGLIEPCVRWVDAAHAPQPAAPTAPATPMSAPAVAPPPVPPEVPPNRPELPPGMTPAEAVQAMRKRIKKLSEDEKHLLRSLIEETYRRLRGDVSKTSAALGFASRFQFYRLLHRLGWKSIHSISLKDDAAP